MTATHTAHATAPTVQLHLAFELGWTQWVLAFTVGHGQAPRLRTIQARDLEALRAEIAKAKLRFRLPADAPVVSCYEAGRDGFWLHRYLTAQGIGNLIVDSSSLEVNRRKRRAKTDRIDAGKLLGLLVRYHNGEKKVWSVVRVPSVAEEDQRQLGRELIALKDEQTQHVNRIKGLLASQGLDVKVDEKFPERLAALRLWDETMRRLLVELGWGWLRWQPTSALSRWYAERFGSGRRARKVGIVAVARKLLVALWRYLDRGEVPEGALLCDWRDKVFRKKVAAGAAEA